MINSITTHDLEILFRKIFDKLKEEKIEKFSFEDDKYWIILTDEWGNFDKMPEPAVGSLADDINFLKLVINDDMSVSYLELERMASVLRMISEILTSSDQNKLQRLS